MAIEQIYSMVKDKAKLEATWLASANEIKREITAGNSVARLTLVIRFHLAHIILFYNNFLKQFLFIQCRYKPGQFFINRAE